MDEWSSSFGPEDSGVIDTFAVGELLASLSNKSLVAFDETTGRYRLLETVREYARIMLYNVREAPDIRSRHLAHFLALVEAGGPQLMGPEQGTWLGRLETEHDNVRAAMDWSAQDPESGEAGLRLVGNLWQFWDVRGYFSEGRIRLERALEYAGAGRRTKERSNALNGGGVLACRQGDYAAAWALHDESLAIRRELGDRRGVAGTLNNMGNVAYYQGHQSAAKTLFEQALEINRELGNRAWQASNLSGLGSVACELGDYAAARRLLEESLGIFRDLGNRWGIAASLGNLGNVAYHQGDYAAARPLREESLAIFNELGDRGGIANELEGIAAAAGGQGYGESAARLWGAAEALREVIGSPLAPYEGDAYDRSVAAVRVAIGEEAFSVAWNEGRALTMEQAVKNALEAHEA